MSKKNYKELAAQILSYVGGKENVNRVYHCQTRLRFTLADEGKANKDALEALDGVRKVMISSGVYQVVIGTDVADVFEELEPLVGTKPEQEEAPARKKGIINTVVDFVSSIFMPIIPALSGAGMLKALLALLVVFKMIDNTSQTYALFNLFSDSVFYFLPMMLAYTAAQKLKCNPILAVGVAGIMIHPSWLGFVAAGEAVHFFGVIPFRLVNYASSVIPVILVVLVQARVEKALNKAIPKAVNMIFVPMLTFLIMGTLALSVLGPIGNVVGGYLALLFDFLSVNASWAPAVLIGTFLPLMVMFGMHTAVGPLGTMQMAELGYDSIFGPGCVCSNIAQGVASLVVAYRTKNSDERSLATSSGITALMGITEPVLYGVNLPKKYPLIASMIGGGFGGLYAGLTHTHRFATGSSGLPAVLLYIGDDTMRYFYNIIISLVITAVVTAVVTFVLSLKYEKQEDSEKIDTPAGTSDAKQISCKEGTIYAPTDGNLVSMEEIPDATFASGVLGLCVGIWSSTGRIQAPFHGTVSLVADTGHAIGITSEDGMELLIHVGVDTVQMNGKGFSPKVKAGEHVKIGQELLCFDRKAVADAGYPDITVVIVTNAAGLDILKTGTICNGEEILRVKQ